MSNIEYVILVIIKLIDSILATSKTILVQKGKGALAAVTVGVSQLIFFKIISDVVTSDSDLKMWLVSITAGIGTYITIQASQKISKDRLYVINVLSDDKDAMTDLCGYLRENKIKNLVTDSYTKDWGKTLAVTVFADTKHQSKLVDKYIENSSTKFLRITR